MRTKEQRGKEHITREKRETRPKSGELFSLFVHKKQKQERENGKVKQKNIF